MLLVAEMTVRDGLKGTDLVAAIITRRVLPLEHWAHIIGLMRDRRYPTRMSAHRLSLEQVADQVNVISKAGMALEWQFGKVPYSWANPAPSVSPWSPFFTTT